MMLKICQFARKHYKPWRNASTKRLLEYFTWYNDRKLLGVAWEGEAVACVISIRCFWLKEHYRHDFVHDDHGPFVRCAIYGAIKPIYIPIAIAELAKDHSEENRVYMWHRDVEELGPPREYSPNQLKRMLLRILLSYERRLTTAAT